MAKWHGLIIALSVAVVVALGVGLPVGLHSSAGEATKAQEIREIVSEFEGRPVAGLELEIIALPDMPLMRATHGKTEYWVNPGSRTVAMVRYGDNEGTQKISITEQEAEAIATRFAQKHCENFSVFTLIRSELTGYPEFMDALPEEWEVSTRCQYDFEWTQIIDGASTPNRVSVSLNPGTGKVISYMSRYELIEWAGSPRVSQEEAVTIVKDKVVEQAVDYEQRWPIEGTGKVTVEGVSIEEAELRIVVEDGKQYLVWNVLARVEEPTTIFRGGRYWIDARTGDILRTSPFS